uniref:ATP synthase complex subunit 8 n=1 Tax=Lythrypnus sp. AC-2023 TaxID=3028465 RepID=A0AA95Z3P5_9GOBI|nr:ATP synthase F0 subunit 8 [Lythrypnus sp. AC-2023]
MPQLIFTPWFAQFILFWCVMFGLAIPKTLTQVAFPAPSPNNMVDSPEEPFLWPWA